MSTNSDDSLPRPAGTAEILTHVLCTTCEHEIPLSEAVVPEAVDYVVYFCGLEYYARWRALADGS